MSRFVLFYRLIVRPLVREPVRTGLTVLAIALGVAVVLAIDLAGNAATGSFRSSMETLSGSSDLEVTASGGVPDAVAGTLARLPYDLRISPRIEAYATLADAKQTVPLIGVDLPAESGDAKSSIAGAGCATAPSQAGAQTVGETNIVTCLEDPSSIWVGASLGRTPGDRLKLTVNDQTQDFIVRGIFPDSNGNEAAIVMDLAAAQRAVSRLGRVDRVLIKTPATRTVEQWQQLLSASLPAGVNVRPQGASTEENRQMLGGFRWNLELLSYISLIVGAFLIYNTVSVSVVRRRPEIGIVRALGASRRMVLGAFLGEAAGLGLLGALAALFLGRIMAVGAVGLIGATVNSLYVTSRPGPIELTAASALLALVIGMGVAVASAAAPASEAASVPPVEAMGRARREYDLLVHKDRDLWIALGLGVAAAAASRVPAMAGKPIFGYVACVLLISSFAFAMPSLIALAVAGTSRWLGRQFGVEALLASRSLAGSLRRTSVLVAALSTAIAMVVSVGIMVGSFRETVIAWMGDELPADIYIRPATQNGADSHPTLSPDLVARIARLRGVAVVDQLRAYETDYEGLPVMIGGADFTTGRGGRHGDFVSGRPGEQVLARLSGSNNVIVSEPFANKHRVSIGQTIWLSLGGSAADFRVIDIYYDYSSERGEILMDRGTLLRYLPDPAPSSLAIYADSAVPLETLRQEISEAAAGYQVLVTSNREIREEGLRVFDRTFAITYALEAVAVLVAVMGIASALLALVIDRRREFGLLRFLGGSARQIRKMILAEAAILGLLANLAGALLGFLLSLILIYVINKQSFGWTIHFHGPAAILLGALTTIYVATVAAAIYPSGIAVRLNPIEVIHEE